MGEEKSRMRRRNSSLRSILARLDFFPPSGPEYVPASPQLMSQFSRFIFFKHKMKQRYTFIKKMNLKLIYFYETNYRSEIFGFSEYMWHESLQKLKLITLVLLDGCPEVLKISFIHSCSFFGSILVVHFLSLDQYLSRQEIEIFNIRLRFYTSISRLISPFICRVFNIPFSTSAFKIRDAEE